MWNNNGSSRPDFAQTPAPGQESVWDYPRPPALVASSAEIAVFAGQVAVASSNRSLKLMETASPPGYYLPPDDVHLDQLVLMPQRSVCEWKGEANYWALTGSPETPVAWSYARPRAAYTALRNFLAFYPSRLRCLLNGEPVQPQPGRFYGGWVTADIVGPFKGDVGTLGW